MLQNPIVSQIDSKNYSTIINLLIENQLPTEDISDKIDFFSFHENGNMIGVGGLEQYGTTGLLRSVAILDPYKGKGLGSKWVKKLLAIAAQKNISELFLLTTTAERFFQTLGFTRIERELVPKLIKTTSEFASVCPSSAAVMSINLSAWTEDASQIFVDYGDFFVPERETQHQIIGDWLASVNSLNKAADLCLGAGKLSEHLLNRFSQLEIIGLDGSQHMLDTSQKNLETFDSRFQGQIFRLEEKAWRSHLNDLDAVVSSLAIHHLDSAEKKELFADLYRMLKPGGVLVIADIIRPTNKSGEEIAAQAWDDFVQKKTNEAGKPEVFELFANDGWNYFRDPDADPIDKPSSIAEQLTWLEEAGFSEVDVSWLYAGHAIFGGRK